MPTSLTPTPPHPITHLRGGGVLAINQVDTGHKTTQVQSLCLLYFMFLCFCIFVFEGSVCYINKAVYTDVGRLYDSQRSEVEVKARFTRSSIVCSNALRPISRTADVQVLIFSAYINL